jgi:hypothetical protein
VGHLISPGLFCILLQVLDIQKVDYTLQKYSSKEQLYQTLITLYAEKLNIRPNRKIIAQFGIKG